MTAYTTFIVNRMLHLSVTPPTDEHEVFRLQTALKPTIRPYSLFPLRSRAEVLSRLTDDAHGRDHDGLAAEAVTITETRAAHRFVELLTAHRFLRPDDLLALHRTIGAWSDPATA